MEFSSLKLKKLIFQEGTYKAPKTNKKSEEESSCPLQCFVIFTAVKQREIFCKAHLNII